MTGFQINFELLLGKLNFIKLLAREKGAKLLLLLLLMLSELIGPECTLYTFYDYLRNNNNNNCYGTSILHESILHKINYVVRCKLWKINKP